MDTRSTLMAWWWLSVLLLGVSWHAIAETGEVVNTLTEKELTVQVNRLQAMIDTVTSDLDSVMTETDRKRLAGVVIRATPREDVEKGVYTTVEDRKPVVRVGLGYVLIFP